MRRTRASLALAGVVQVGVATASHLPRGVGPEFVKFFEEHKPTFTCIANPSIIIKASEINDNSCDCPDGSDEPGTSACAHLDRLSPEQPLPASLTGSTNTSNAFPGFWCENKGHIGSYLPLQYVNDGVCDYDICCDGSEEFAGVGSIKCEDRCASIGHSYRKLQQDRQKSKERADKQRRALADQARLLRNTIESSIASTEDELKSLGTLKADLTARLQEVERQERGNAARSDSQPGKLGVLVNLAKNRITELRASLESFTNQREFMRDKVEALETILKKLHEEYNPNFNDAGVKAAVKSWEDYAAMLADQDSEPEISVAPENDEDIQWSDFVDDVTDSDLISKLEAYMPTSLRGLLHDRLDALRLWLIEKGLLADTRTAGGESRLLTAARQAVKDVEDQISSKETALYSQQHDLETDYGSDDIFRPLKGKCISIDSGEYEYELCWLGKTTQKSKKGHGNTNMGNFVRIDAEMADEQERADGKGLGQGPRIVHRYENGMSCWNGPQRRTDVWLVCHESEELWRVSENEKCVYQMEVGTPAACQAMSEPPVPAKDEL